MLHRSLASQGRPAIIGFVHEQVYSGFVLKLAKAGTDHGLGDERILGGTAKLPRLLRFEEGFQPFIIYRCRPWPPGFDTIQADTVYRAVSKWPPGRVSWHVYCYHIPSGRATGWNPYLQRTGAHAMTTRPIIGWREWLALPSLGIPAIKAKVDTGARTSALHTFDLSTYTDNGHDYVKFHIHPLQRRTDIELECTAPIIDRRMVRDSGGRAEERIVIMSDLSLGENTWPVEITLTNRDDMLFRMLLGREGIRQRGLLVDPAVSYRNGKALARSYGVRKTQQTPPDEDPAEDLDED